MGKVWVRGRERRLEGGVGGGSVELFYFAWICVLLSMFDFASYLIDHLFLLCIDSKLWFLQLGQRLRDVYN
jgi:hypothetical protein